MTTAGNTLPGTAGPSTGDGRVLFVGAGPGNPELLTVRAREILENTTYAWVASDVAAPVRDLIAAELPVPESKREAADRAWQAEVAAAKEAGSRRRPPRPTGLSAAEIVVTGDVDHGGVPLPPAELARQLVDQTRESGRVVRLVAGNPVDDPTVLEELREVQALGAEFEVIPGMTGAGALPAFTGIPTGEGYTALDLRGVAAASAASAVAGSDSATGAAGADGAQTCAVPDWDRVAAAPQPLIITTTPADLATIARELKSRGVAGSTPATVTTHATTRLQRSYDVTLDTLKSVVASSGPLAKETEMPAELVVTVGAQASRRSKYSWWENRALYGWNVLVPRAKSQAGPMSARLTAHGAIPIEVPTISTEPPRNPAQMERAIKGLVDGRYQWIVFTSVNAVKAVWEKFADFGLDARALAGVRVAAVGQKTAQAVRDLGITPELLPRDNARNAAGLVEVFPPYDEDLDPVDRVLLPRADIATDTLVAGLIDLGWSVEDVVAYRTVRAAPPSQEIRDMIKSGGFDAVCFTSSSTVKNLVGIAGKPHTRTIIACIGPMAAQTAREHGLRVDVMPEVAGVPELVDALAAHVAKLRASGELPPPRKRRRRRRTQPES
ncbi:uroporphyrinogen-III synthase [Corynebacterium nuruki]|jgi:uroporphyrinogen III methyltransferase/synthase|uniref:Bifunctional uroporphyrinogen-III C-methyltransferase/uroporphyrinogen-III synthase n=1 Tax=Corynebacterium nuruki TaxID=1032851 RepID=A0A3D4SVY3_9CORY|nr:uroporphyrinogen-III synthase [Corynebacterium nuruki]HCT13392.1 bifunctional uroporphyrinogen-III C-methyltransferase/uroporphyrinogen-III synthase [Corynebacterium nuruki]